MQIPGNQNSQMSSLGDRDTPSSPGYAVYQTILWGFAVFGFIHLVLEGKGLVWDKSPLWSGGSKSKPSSSSPTITRRPGS